MRSNRSFLVGALALCLAVNLAAAGFPDPAVDNKNAGAAPQTAVLAGGCFWCTEVVFQHIEGVTKVVSGYAGGDASAAHYEMVSTGKTGHAETVQVTYDPRKISYGQLLKVFFSVAHDPTQLNRQGPDVGPQYRSAIFYADAMQKSIAEAYIAQLTKTKTFDAPIVTQVVPLKAFYVGEDFHQNFCNRNPNNSYVRNIAIPKLDKVKKQVPELVKK